MSLAKLIETIIKIMSSRIYGVVQESWAWAHSVKLLHSEKVSIPVISVGAIAIGGSGKTPFTMFMADRLHRLGYKPVICSRGYKGSYTGRYRVVSDGMSHQPLVTPDVCGDEPYLMACRLKHVPVLVGRKRIDAVRASIELLNCDVAILDDGFQHLALRRDINLVLLDSRMDRMFPAGSLREPFQALDRADIILLNGSPDHLPRKAMQHIGEKPIFSSQQQADCLMKDFGSDELSTDLLIGRKVALVSAIANPRRFTDMAEKLGWIVTQHAIFDDHKSLSDEELSDLVIKTKDLPMVLTEKDWVKTPRWFRELPRSYALRIRVVIDDENKFFKLVLSYLKNYEP